ncbi:aromatic acid exporter family protein [Neobacillus sp. PS3-12]|jgi:uncharacterized membrane protein YgaE (UPF0421/DUF939 family)|uniref:FUSC family protein n=1 Tax=Neobacillus sp. PS3-12 TaxID=3070677 RepID=UPI0027DFE0B3|nr:aromatic acid exporter family protein [Neobacillus sp. PS3-12]WML51304.1 aromatic acid exporter family protein [Neobacillus sp. PS3-12]
MKLGARIFKTGIAIVLSLYLAQLLHSPSPIFAAIAAIFAIQPTIYRSYLSIIEQVQGNIIGALVSILAVLVLGNSFIVIGFAAIIVIIINLKLKIENTIGLSLVTLLAIMESTGGNFLQFSFIRFSTIMLGVLSAFIVNLIFMPPKYEQKLYTAISSTTEEMIRWIRLSSRHAFDHNHLKLDIEKLKENRIQTEQFYLMYKEERGYFKKYHLEKSRKLVIYRQMINAVKKGLDTLKRLHRYENELLHLPLTFQQSIQAHLDILIYHHEQIMLRYIGKVPTPSSLEQDQVNLDKKELLDFFLDYQKEANDKSDQGLYHTIQIITGIFEYGEHVEHLDRLITSFISHHENEVSIKK